MMGALSILISTISPDVRVTLSILAALLLRDDFCPKGVDWWSSGAILILMQGDLAGVRRRGRQQYVSRDTILVGERGYHRGSGPECGEGRQEIDGVSIIITVVQPWSLQLIKGNCCKSNKCISIFQINVPWIFFGSQGYSSDWGMFSCKISKILNSDAIAESRELNEASPIALVVGGIALETEVFQRLQSLQREDSKNICV